MIKALLLSILLIAGIIIGPMFAGHQGYVLIQTDKYNIETSVTGLIIILALLMLLLFIIEWIIRRISLTGSHTRDWFLGRKRKRARKQTHAGLVKLAEGDYQKAEKLMARNADHAEQPAINYLMAAEAAQQRGDSLQVNQYLQLAAEAADGDTLPVDITRVRIQLAREEFDEARHGIDALLNRAPRHPEVLRLAEQAYLHTHSYEALIDLIPSLTKANLHTDKELLQLQHDAYLGLMHQSVKKEGNEGLLRWWTGLNRKIRQDINIQTAAIKQFIACNDMITAQQIIVDSLKQHVDERLLVLLPLLKSEKPEALETLLEKRIHQVGASAALNSALGQIKMQRGEWQAASEALRAALKERPDAQDYACLADVLEKIHRPEEAAKMRREGLQLVLKQTQPNEGEDV